MCTAQKTNFLTQHNFPEPRITYEAAKSREGIPNVNIIFPDGHEDSFVLERHYASPEHRMSGELHCNFIGHLKNEKSACVAVTGCYDREDVELTIHSKHNTDANMYVLRKDGSVKSIESNFKVKKSIILTFKMVFSDSLSFRIMSQFEGAISTKMMMNSLMKRNSTTN